MKKTIYFLVASLLFAACGQSPEEKAKKLVEESVKKSLYHPESYEPVEVILDSAFAPKDDPEVYEKAVKLCKLSKSGQEYEDNMKRAKSSMAIWSGPYMSSYSRNEYNEAKEKFDFYNDKVEETRSKIEKIYKDIVKLAEPGRRFIGFKVSHKFRAKNNNGDVLMGSYIYLVDKNITEILAEYDTESEEYQMVHALYEAWAEKAEEALEEEEDNESD